MLELGIALGWALVELLPPSVREARKPFVEELAQAIHGASEEATCTGPWSETSCRPSWPGSAAELDAFTGAFAFWESGFVARIQAGHCAPHECDGVIRLADGSIGPRAATAFQLQGLSLERRDEAVGLEPMRLYEAARAAERMIALQRTRCHGADWAACTFTGLAGTLRFRQAPARAASFRRVLTKIELRSTR